MILFAHIYEIIIKMVSGIYFCDLISSDHQQQRSFWVSVCLSVVKSCSQTTHKPCDIQEEDPILMEFFIFFYFPFNMVAELRLMVDLFRDIRFFIWFLLLGTHLRILQTFLKNPSFFSSVILPYSFFYL